MKNGSRWRDEMNTTKHSSHGIEQNSGLSFLKKGTCRFKVLLSLVVLVVVVVIVIVVVVVVLLLLCRL